MLSRAESTFVFGYIALCSVLHLIPYKIDRKTGNLSTLSPKRHLLWALVYAGSALHAGNTIREVLRQVTTGVEATVLHHFTIQLDWSVCPLIALTSTLFLHTFSPNLVTLVFNELYKEDSGNRRKWMQFNQVELLAVYFPIFFVSIPFCLGVIILLEPTMSHLIINSIPGANTSSSSAAFAGSFILELYAISVWVYNIGFFLVINCLVFAKVENELERIVQSCKRDAIPETCLRLAYKKCRQLHLFLSFFNKINARFLYSLKLIALFIAVSHGYFAIKYFDRNAFLGTYNLYLCINAQVAYGLTFKRAFGIPEAVKGCRRQILHRCKGSKSGRTMYVAKAVASVPAIGLKVGSFHEVERNSTLIFINFVVSQMVGLLIASR